MSQAQVQAVNPSVVAAIQIDMIDQLVKSGAMTVQAQADHFKKMLLAQSTVAQVVPQALPTASNVVAMIPVANPVTIAHVKPATPATANHTRLTRVCRGRTVMTQDVEDNVIAKIKLGVDCLEIARDANVSEAKIRMLCKEHGLQYASRYGNNHRHLNSAEKAQIKRLYDAGHPITVIQIRMDISYSTANRYCTA